MIKSIKKILRSIIFVPFHILNFLAKLYSKILTIIDPNGSECYWNEISQNEIDKKTSSNLRLKDYTPYPLKNNNITNEIIFYTPTKISSYRASTYLSKEKDTIEWIEKYGKDNQVFFDIGSNMGIYSIFFAKLFNSKVFSFEPSFRNLDLLVRNIEINKLNDHITVIANPVYSYPSVKTFSQSTNRVAGMALSTFGKKNTSGFNFNTLGFSIDKLREENLILKPNLVKIDVDGNELDVIEGALQTIRNNSCKTLLIETRESTSKNLEKLISKCGFKKDDTLNFKSQSNEIWTKF